MQLKKVTTQEDKAFDKKTIVTKWQGLPLGFV